MCLHDSLFDPSGSSLDRSISDHTIFPLQMTVYLESGSKFELVSLAADRMMTNCVAFIVDFTACLCLQDS